MIKRKLTAFFFAVLLAGAVGIRSAPAQNGHEAQVNFGGAESVIALKPDLAPYHAGAAEADGSLWYMLNVTNDSVRPAIRVLIAGQPASAGLNFLPQSMRPAILTVASSDSGIIVESASAYGHGAWRIIIPPATSAELALRVGAAASPPALYAWTEPALADHNRQLAIFITAVGALIGASVLIMAGLAILIGHAAPRWVALTLLLLLLSWLAETGMFDASLATHIGGPYGLSALLTGLALAAGARLADAIIQVREVWPRAELWFRRGLLALLVLCGAAYLGLPGATLLTDIIVVLGAALIAFYLVYCGRKGDKAAQVVAPSAAAFALVALAAAVAALSGDSESLMAPAAMGGFAAAGSLLLALAVIASEEIAVLPFLHGSSVARLLEARAGTDDAVPSDELARAAIVASRQGVFDLDFHASLVTLSPESAAIAGLGEHQVTLSHGDWMARLHEDDRETYRQAIEHFSHHPGSVFRLEFRLGMQDGDYAYLALRATAQAEGGSAARCLGLLGDAALRPENETADPSQCDALTGLGNRVALMRALDRPELFGPALLALIDIDRFKAIHASLGDSGGDGVLIKIAERLRKKFSSRADIFRVGGDCFALLFTDAAENAGDVGGEIVETCAASHVQGGRNIFAPVSAGLAAGADCEDPLALIKNAELALMQAKRQGGACAKFYESGFDTHARGDAVALETDLRHALQQKEIELFYQPIMRLSDRAIAGFEALLRWRHPAKGLIAPADFIAHSEETGLIVALGRFALERAADDLAHWQRFFPLVTPLFVSVNLSRRQLRDGEFETLLARVLGTGRLVPGSLKLEITESAVSADLQIQETLTRIRAAGAGLALDDFGIGSSSLSQLRNLPFDAVKIDKSFLTRQGGGAMDVDGEVVLSSIVSLAHDLGRAVIVEGVESERDALWLDGIGCEFGQGYYFSAPLPPAEAIEFIARHYDVTAVKND